MKRKEVFICDYCNQEFQNHETVTQHENQCRKSKGIGVYAIFDVMSEQFLMEEIVGYDGETKVELRSLNSKKIWFSRNGDICGNDTLFVTDTYCDAEKAKKWAEEIYPTGEYQIVDLVKVVYNL